MRKSSIQSAVFAVLVGATASVPAFASGSYSGRPPVPPAKTGDPMKMDREKYGLGQKVYDGSAMTPGAGNADAQLARLKAVQMQLPSDAAKMKDLPTLAGKLSTAQLDALEYFVAQRFAVKK